MSFLTDIWRQLVRRRLWPVAVLLVAALAAVPVLLAKEPAASVEASTPAAPQAAVSSELIDAPIVTASDDSTRTPGRKPLGKTHDIFKSTAKKPKVTKVTKVDEADTTAKESSKEPETKTEPSGGGGSSTPAAPVAPAPVVKPKTYPLYSLAVRFGATDGDAARSTVSRDEALPSTAQPILIYLGLMQDHKTAVFLVDASATAVGDGECHPTPESCETIRLQAGETEFIDVTDELGNPTAQFQLDLVKIHKSTTGDAAKSARSSRLAKVASVSGASLGSVRGIDSSASRSR